MPFGPALPKGVRTPSTKTTSRNERDMGPPRKWIPARTRAAPSSYPSVTKPSKAARRGLTPKRPRPGSRPEPARSEKDRVLFSGGCRRGGEEVAGQLDLPLPRATGPQRRRDRVGVARIGRAPHQPAHQVGREQVLDRYRVLRRELREGGAGGLQAGVGGGVAVGPAVHRRRPVARLAVQRKLVLGQRLAA